MAGWQLAIAGLLALPGVGIGLLLSYAVNGSSACSSSSSG